MTVPGQGYRFVAGVQHLIDVRPDCTRPAISIFVRQRTLRWSPCRDATVTSLCRGRRMIGDRPPLPGTSNTSSRRWAWRLSIGTLAATSLGFLATTVAVLLLRSAGPNPQPRRTLQRITFDEAALPRDAAWAPDGQWVVYESDLAGNAEIWKQRVGIPTRFG